VINLRPFQKKAIDLLEKNKHVLCLSPTGSGKSLIFERRIITKNYRTLIVSPLIALARQQQKDLEKKGIQSVLGCGPEAYSPPQKRNCTPQAWITNPEKLFFNNKIKQEVKIWNPHFLVIDECHCLFEWSHFRPGFQKLTELVEQLNLKESLWLTATLSSSNQKKLLDQLPKNAVQMGDFQFPSHISIKIHRCPWGKRFDLMKSILQKRTGFGIIFTVTRKSAERVTKVLKKEGYSAIYYHAGLSSEERKIIEKQSLKKEITILVATSAFGMGMNLTHVTWVCLWHLPLNLISLAQMIGRAGRSGKASFADIFWDNDDFYIHHQMNIEKEEKKSLYSAVINPSEFSLKVHKYFNG
tara:strand:+ start:830 stop:1894 length:1065 start_codon:yes stop_codon:yes gene_type:complete